MLGETTTGDDVTTTACYMRLTGCGPAVAWLTTNPAANTVHLCQHCLDWWFDEADTHTDTEPASWGWIRHAAFTDEQIAGALIDPRNRDQVAQVLRYESRRDPQWFREVVWREELRRQYGRFARPR